MTATHGLTPPPALDGPTKRIIVSATLAAHHYLLRGMSGNPTLRAEWDRMREPQPGDLIVELSTAYRRLRDTDDSYEAWAGHCLTYVGDVREQVVPDPDDTEPWFDTFGLCLNPDGTEYRWSNHEFLAVPAHRPRWPG
jgi:hypothetical protein